MRQVFTVFDFTIKTAARKKAFIVSTVIMFTIALILSLVPKGIDVFIGDGKGNNVENNVTYHYIDEDNVIDNGAEYLQKYFPEVKVKEGTKNKLSDYKDRILNKEKEDSVILVSEKAGVPQIKLITKDFISGVDSDKVMEALRQAYRIETLSKLNLNNEEINEVEQTLELSVDSVGKMNGSAYAMSIVLTLMMFFAIYYYGYSVAMSIATEKSSRVMETLIVSAKPSKVLLGKVLAMGILGLLQFGGLLLFAGICFKMFIPKNFIFEGFKLDFSYFDLSTILLLLLYFILGYILYAVMNSVCGAMVDRMEDLNSAMMPVVFIAIISFYLGYMSSIMGASGVLVKVAMYLPFSAPFIMPFQLLNDNVESINVILSILSMLVAIIIITIISMKIYAASVLRYGKVQKKKK